MRLASLKGQPCGRHPYRRPLGWRLRLGYHTGLPHVKPTPENFLLRLHVLAWIMLAGELLPWMLHFHRPWFQKNVLDMGYALGVPGFIVTLYQIAGQNRMCVIISHILFLLLGWIPKEGDSPSWPEESKETGGFVAGNPTGTASPWHTTLLAKSSGSSR